MGLEGFSFILASASQRRRKLLAEAGCQFDVIPSGLDEGSISTEGLSPDDYAKKVAFAKAGEVADRFPSRLVIGADTVVDFEGRLVGKPADDKDAERITRMLFSRPHRVITGVAILRKNDSLQIIDSDSTTVYPRKISEQQLEEHIKGGSWRDKAGAYAIKEDGDALIERIEGSLTNVIGLPMELLEQMIRKVNSR